MKIKELNLKVGETISRKKIIGINDYFIYLECTNCGIKNSIHLGKDESCLYEHSRPDIFCRTGCHVNHRNKNIDFVKDLKINDIIFNRFSVIHIDKNFTLQLECVACSQQISIKADHADITAFVNKGKNPENLIPGDSCCAMTQKIANSKIAKELQKEKQECAIKRQERQQQLKIDDAKNVHFKKGSKAFYIWRGDEINIEILSETNGIPIGTIQKNLALGCTVTEAVSINGFVGEDILKAANDEDLDFELLKKLIRKGSSLEGAVKFLNENAFDNLSVLLRDPKTR